MPPKGTLANGVVVIESMAGIFGVALLTGLLFAKFSRTSSRILFADKAVITVRDGKKVFMFRVANERGSFVVEADARVTMLKDEVTREGERMRRLLDLPLVRGKSPFAAVGRRTRGLPRGGDAHRGLDHGLRLDRRADRLD